MDSFFFLLLSLLPFFYLLMCVYVTVHATLLCTFVCVCIGGVCQCIAGVEATWNEIYRSHWSIMMKAL